MEGHRADGGDVQRALASLVLTTGLIIASLTLSGWWFQRTVLDPTRTADVADAVIDQPEAREALAEAIGNAIAAKVPGAPADLDATIAARLAALEDPGFLGRVIADAHARLVGAETGPVTVDPSVVAALVDPALAEAAGPISWNVPTVSPLRSARDRLDGLVTTGLVLSLLLVLAGAMLHPRHDKALRTIGAWAIGAAAWQLVTAYVFPVILLPKLTDNPWASVASAVAKARMASLVGVLVSLAGAGGACMVVSVLFAPHRRTAAAPTTNVAPPPMGRTVVMGHQPPVGAGSVPRPTRGFSATHQRPEDGRARDEDGWLL